MRSTGTALWGWAMTASGIAIAVISPILGAIADAGGRRKPWLFAFTVRDRDRLPLALVRAAGPRASRCTRWWSWGSPTSAFEVAGVFYNAMLPEIVSRDYLGRLSGWAWGLGYAGGLACLILALFAFDPDRDAAVRARQGRAPSTCAITGPLVGLWLALFSLPLFLFTPDRQSSGLPAARGGPARASTSCGGPSPTSAATARSCTS